MAWVRGHYRRRPRGFGRRHSKAGSQALGALIGALFALAATGAVAVLLLGAVVGAIGVGFAFVSDHRRIVLVVLILFLSCAAGLILRNRAARRQREATRNRLEALSLMARGLIDQPQIDTEATAQVVALREAAGPLPQDLVAELESCYREAVARAVADRNVSPREREKLDRMLEAFDVSSEAAQRAEVEAFLDVYARIVADDRLTEAEEAQLAQVRTALRIPDDAVAAQARFAEWLASQRRRFEAELKRAAEVRSSPLAPIEAPIQLKKGERCYYAAEFTEKKERVSRSYVADGVRHTEKALESVRSGVLYVTSDRLLLVASGTTTIKLERILDHGVDSDSRLLGVTVDGRQAPFTFELGEPFVAAAFIERATAAADRE